MEATISRMLATVSASALLAACGPALQPDAGSAAASHAGGGSAAARLPGTWTLVSREIRRVSDGELVTIVSGTAPVGLLMIDAQHFSVQIITENYPRFPEGRIAVVAPQATPEQLRAALVAYTGYFGRYRVDESRGMITIHVAGGTGNVRDTDQHRFFSFAGDTLVLRETSTFRGLQGEELTGSARWVRAP